MESDGGLGGIGANRFLVLLVLLSLSVFFLCPGCSRRIGVFLCSLGPVHLILFEVLGWVQCSCVSISVYARILLLLPFLHHAASATLVGAQDVTTRSYN
jgi:hypothetical protein